MEKVTPKTMGYALQGKNINIDYDIDYAKPFLNVGKYSDMFKAIYKPEKSQRIVERIPRKLVDLQKLMIGITSISCVSTVLSIS